MMDNDTFERVSALDFSPNCAPDGVYGVYGTYKQQTAGKAIDIDVQLVSTLRSQYPELTITTVPTANANLLQFAAAGFATAELDLEDETVVRWRGYIPPTHRGQGQGQLVDATFFARYHYRWGQEDFILYTIKYGLSDIQYILKEPRAGEPLLGHSRVTDALISAVGSWLSSVADALYVFDGRWYKSPAMWKDVQKASWDNVILDPKMKKELVAVCDTFFDSQNTYKEFGVPWKRGLIFYGPPGNGKTISIKALMHSMYQRKHKIPCLYVKSAPYTYMLEMVFQVARAEAPCLLVFEDIDTVVTPNSRAYFFNEVDGVASNDGIMMIASTNYLDRLDPGLTKRPSRFDRKYLFPQPSWDERVLYAQYWQQKVKDKPIEFPDEICPAVADITDGFSFAYLQELFIASVLQLVRGDAEGPDTPDKGDDDCLDKFPLWRALKHQAKVLREDLGSKNEEPSAEQHAPGGEIEPQVSAQVSTALPVTACGTRLPTAFADGHKHSVGGRRLTPQEALMSLESVASLADRVWQWGPSGRKG